MADVRAFRAFRYDPGQAGTLSDLVAPPYDVIGPDLQQALYDRSPHNVIRLELNKPEPGDDDLRNRYTRAGNFLRDWIDTGVLRQDSARSLYVCHQEYQVEGRTFTRKGFFARVRLEPFGTGHIFPHEQTLAGPKADRLSLYTATGFNLSPVFALYPDDAGEVQAALDDAVGRALPVEATDHLGVVSRLWPVTDDMTVSRVVGLLGSKPLFIADGHHRYETGLRYLADRQAHGDAQSEDHPARFILMNLVGMSDPGLLILPTHRVVCSLRDGLDAAGLRAALADKFDVEVVGTGDEAARTTWESMEADGSQAVLGFCTRADGVWQLARLRDTAALDALAADHSPAWRGLAVSVLHVLVLGHLLKDWQAGPTVYRFPHLLGEVLAETGKSDWQLAALVPPATMDHVTDIAGGRETMPPKSTYFYPKLLSGLVFNSLKAH